MKEREVNHDINDPESWVQGENIEVCLNCPLPECINCKGEEERVRAAERKIERHKEKLRQLALKEAHAELAAPLPREEKRRLNMLQAKQAERHIHFNFDLLRVRINRIYDNYRGLADALGINAGSVYNKMGNQNYWKDEEILLAAKALDIPESQIVMYFFNGGEREDG